MRQRRRTLWKIVAAIAVVYLVSNSMCWDLRSKMSTIHKDITIMNTRIVSTGINRIEMVSQRVPSSSTTAPPYEKEMSFTNFSYPMDIDIVKLIQDYKHTGQIKHRPINDFKHRYLHNPTNRCASNQNSHTADVFLLFVVKSKSEHWQQRKAIRETWGNESYLRNFNIRTVFILGFSEDESMSRVWLELKSYNDIILMDFQDTYFNNTLKTSTAFNWVPEFCSKARFVMLVDDDIYVSLKTLVLFLDQLPMSQRVQLYMGRTYRGFKPHRNVTSKWHVPVSEYQWDTYPPFVAAGTVIMTMDFVSDVRTAMRYTKPFRLDDVYMAILAFRLGVDPVRNENVYGYRVSFNRLVSDALTSHGFTPMLTKTTWKLHMSLNLKQNHIII